VKLPDRCPARARGLRPRARTGYTLIEVLIASVVLAAVLAGAMTFLGFAGASVSGITAQNVANGKAGSTLEFIQSRARFATSVSNDASGNALTLGFDDNYAVDSDGDGKSYNDKNHFERFKFVGVNSTNTADCASNHLDYIPNIALTTTRVLITNGVRNLPGYKIFTVTNFNTATVIRFGIVDCKKRDNFQAVEIQGTAVSLNRPASTNIVSILP
jgi:prepilin-type N-terminal cleavage/methylation domain-containing protein